MPSNCMPIIGLLLVLPLFGCHAQINLKVFHQNCLLGRGGNWPLQASMSSYCSKMDVDTLVWTILLAAIGSAMLLRGAIMHRVLCISQVQASTAKVGFMSQRSFAQRRVLRPPRMVSVKAAAVDFFGTAPTWEELGVLTPEVERTLIRQKFARPSRVQVWRMDC